MRFYRLTTDRRYAEIQPDGRGRNPFADTAWLPISAYRSAHLPDLADWLWTNYTPPMSYPAFRDAVNRVEKAEERAEAESAAPKPSGRNRCKR